MAMIFSSLVDRVALLTLHLWAKNSANCMILHESAEIMVGVGRFLLGDFVAGSDFG
jgi:hypothetical protein